MSSVTANSRMIYAFSRDGALPGSAIWHRVNKRTRTPTNAIWAGGRRRADPRPAVPGEHRGLRRGDLHRHHRLVRRLRDPDLPAAAAGRQLQARTVASGRWSYAIGWTAVVWVVIIFFLFMLPQFGPIKWSTFNYAVVAVAVVIGFAGIYWLVSAKNWFTGPKVQGSAEELAAIERELSA